MKKPPPPPEPAEEQPLAPLLGRILLGSLEELLGAQELGDILHAAGLARDLAAYSENNLELQFSTQTLDSILKAMENRYGRHASCGLTLRAGEVSFKEALYAFGPQLGLHESEFKLLPLKRKLSAFAQALADLLAQQSGARASLAEAQESLVLELAPCPLTLPSGTGVIFSHFVVGLLAAALYWLSGGKHFRLTAAENFVLFEGLCRLVLPLVPAA